MFVVGQSYGAFEHAAAAAKALKTGHHRMSLLILQVRNTVDASGSVSFDRLDADATDYAVFGLSRVAVFWGYVSHQSLASLYSDHLPRSFCKPTPPVYLLQPHREALMPFASFDGYASLNNTLSEASLEVISGGVNARLMMYAGQWADVSRDHVYLPTSESVCLDSFVYYLIAHSVTDEVFRHKYSSFDRSDIRRQWLKLERSVLDYRMQCSPLSTLIDRFLPSYAKRVSDVPSAIRSWRPFEREYITIPFEHTPAHLIASRSVYLHAGVAYLPRSALLPMISKHLMSVHTRNIDHVMRQPAIQHPSNLQRLVTLIRQKFVLFFGQSVPTISMNVDAIRQFAPACIQQLMSKAVDVKNKQHLKYPERDLFARYLLAMNWKKEQIVKLWHHKMMHVYERTTDPPEVVSQVRSLERKHLLYASKGVSRVDASCYEYCRKGACPFDGEKAGCAKKQLLLLDVVFDSPSVCSTATQAAHR
jgi:hypothetical protein